MFNLKEIIAITGGKILLEKANPKFTGISIDSRTIKQGEIFLCLKGEKFDGHDFISKAINGGAEGLILSQHDKWNKSFISSNTLLKLVVLIKKDSVNVLGDIASYHRKRFNIPVIGITGSNGKTTTKEITASILKKRFCTLKNKGNFNNLIGVPLTLLNLLPEHQAAVIEMGMNKPGEIKRLSTIAKPSFAVITNVCEAHIENFNSIKEIKEEKEELVKSLDNNSTAILNCDDPLVYEMNMLARCRVITYGLSPLSIVKAKDIGRGKNCKYKFTLSIEKKSVPINLSMWGYHNIYNAISAAAVGYSMGIGIEDIKEGIEASYEPPMRTEIKEINDITIINDSYNANPKSVEAAIRTLSDIGTDGRKVLIFGDMLELGKASENSHKNIGIIINNSNIDILIIVGNQAKLTAKEAQIQGMSSDKIFICKNINEASEIASELIKKGDYILIKGSRSMNMNKVLDNIFNQNFIQ